MEALPYAEWQWIMERAPWPVVDLFVLSEKGIWLIRRQATGSDISYDGMWHLPGGFILKGEGSRTAVVRILEKELGISNDDGLKIDYASFPFNDPFEARGHLMHALVEVDLRGTGIEPRPSERAGFFRVAGVENLPSPMIPHHVRIIRQYLRSRPTFKNLFRVWILSKKRFVLIPLVIRRLVREVKAPPVLENTMKSREIAHLFNPRPTSPS